MEDFLDGDEDAVGRGRGGDNNVVGKPGDGLADADGTGFPDPNTMRLVMAQSGADIPTIQAVGGKTGTFGRGAVDEDTAARGREGGAVVVEHAFNLFPGREVRVHAGATEEVHGEFDVRNEFVP